MNRDLLDFQMRLVQAQIHMNGMVAENMQRQVLGESMAYTHSDFENLISEFGIHHNELWNLNPDHSYLPGYNC
jgi:hypothetical protein